MPDDVWVNDLEAVGTFEGLRLCDQCLSRPESPRLRRGPGRSTKCGCRSEVCEAIGPLI